MIANWNSVVDKEDNIFHLGDFAFGSAEYIKTILSRLNGKKHLVLGNHDNEIRKRPEMFKEHFVWIKDVAEIYIEGQLIVLSHYPILEWDRISHGSYMLYGHLHRDLPEDLLCRRLHVGVDTNNYTPVSFEQIKIILDKRPIFSHHDR